jgi:predicted O-methyltransferase YrrM
MKNSSSIPSKVLRLFALLPRRPREFYDRVTAMVDSRVERYRHGPSHYETLHWDTLTQQLGRLLSADVEAILREDELGSIQEEVSSGIRALSQDAPFSLFHNGDFALARLCYALVRLTRPSSVVETGVCYGVSSAFLLQALRVNGGGRLHSIDLPPLGKAGDEFVGRFIPKRLHSDWRLYRGRSVDLLPKLVRELGKIDFFVHDSLHTYRNMHREFEVVTPFLAPRSVVVADDVERNSAFKEWATRFRPAYSAVLKEESKQSLLGITVFRAENRQANAMGS